MKKNTTVIPNIDHSVWEKWRFVPSTSDFLLRIFTEGGAQVEACEGIPIDLRNSEEQLTSSQKVLEAIQSVSDAWNTTYIMAAVFAAGVLAVVIALTVIGCKKKLSDILLPF